MVIIAEIGKNFVVTQEPEPLDVLLARAKKLIHAAKQSGCNVAKFQVHNVDDEIHPEARVVSPHFDHDRYEWVKRNTYPVDFWWQIKEYCREVSIDFLATPMSRGAAELLREEAGDVDSWKIGSGDILDFVMLDYARDTGKPVILSSGMSSFEELMKSYRYVAEKVREVTIMNCVSMYPCPLAELNLNTIPFLKKRFPKASIGFSDHSLGIEGSLMAASMGVSVIEKHFTFDRNAWGPDHKVSLLPQEMKELVNRIGSGDLLEPTSEALGVPTKFIQQEEMKFRPVFRKGLYAFRAIQEGEIFEPDIICALRPKLPNAKPSEEYPALLGTTTQKSYEKYQPL